MHDFDHNQLPLNFVRISEKLVNFFLRHAFFLHKRFLRVDSLSANLLLHSFFLQSIGLNQSGGPYLRLGRWPGTSRRHPANPGSPFARALTVYKISSLRRKRLQKVKYSYILTSLCIRLNPWSGHLDRHCAIRCPTVLKTAAHANSR